MRSDIGRHRHVQESAALRLDQAKRWLSWRNVTIALEVRRDAALYIRDSRSFYKILSGRHFWVIIVSLENSWSGDSAKPNSEERREAGASQLHNGRKRGSSGCIERLQRLELCRCRLIDNRQRHNQWCWCNGSLSETGRFIKSVFNSFRRYDRPCGAVTDLMSMCVKKDSLQIGLNGCCFSSIVASSNASSFADLMLQYLVV